MSWNYRVTRRIHKHPYLHDSEILYEVREVYYDNNGDIVNMAEMPDVIGESVDELENILDKMTKCCKKPVIDYNTGEEI